MRSRTPPTLGREGSWVYIVSKHREKEGVCYFMKPVKRQLVKSTNGKGRFIRYDSTLYRLHPPEALDKLLERAARKHYFGMYGKKPPDLPFVKLWLG
jgi:hypothetical protein